MSDWTLRLTKSLHQARSQPESRYFQLATLTEDLVPANRTVVFRYLDNVDNALVVVADTRSAKWSELSLQPKASVCWYFSKSREQYRFIVHGEGHTRETAPELIDKQWSKLSDAGRKQYFWGQPGSVKQSNGPLRVTEDMSHPPEHFCVLKLLIKSVDYLSLQGNPQYREKHWLDSSGKWVSQPIIP